MGIYIIAVAALIAIAAWIFLQIWKIMLKFFYYFLVGVEALVSSLIVAVRRSGKVCFILWYKVKEKYFKKEAPQTNVYEVHPDDVPAGLLQELNSHDEVIVKKNPIQSNEF